MGARRPSRAVAMGAWIALGLMACSSEDPGTDSADVVGALGAPGEVAEVGEARRNAIVKILHETDGALDRENQKAKYDAMSVSPFTFYRGSARLFYRDFSRGGPQWDKSPFASRTAVTWLQGDLHTENFGVFDDPHGRAVYDVNDFDETYVGSYLLDLWRLSTSIVLVAEQNGGFSKSDEKALASAALDSYLDTLESFRGNDDETHASMRTGDAYGVLDEVMGDVEDDASRKRMLDEWTKVDKGARRFLNSNPKLAPASDAERAAITGAMSGYVNALEGPLRGDASYFRVLDIARRLDAGTGSLGAARYYVLVEGPSGSDKDDHILDVKAQSQPAFLSYLRKDEREAYAERFPAATSGCRVAMGQRALLGAEADPHAGCLNALGLSLSVRDRSPFKETLDFTELTSMTRLRKLAEQWAAVTATAHARADRDFDASFVSSSLEHEVADLTRGRRDAMRAEVSGLALRYADQVKIDHGLFLDARRRGALP